MGLGIAALAGLCLGVLAGTLPLFGAALSPLLTVLSMVPPLAILPILFIVFGLDELSKVMLIVIGITPVLARDLEQQARQLPAELLIKAQTLGANTWTLILRVVLPQLMPRLLIALRLVLGSAWLFLIAAEAIASTDASATASSSCVATCRWTSSCPTSPGSRCSPGRWTTPCAA